MPVSDDGPSGLGICAIQLFNYPPFYLFLSLFLELRVKNKVPILFQRILDPHGNGRYRHSRLSVPYKACVCTLKSTDSRFKYCETYNASWTRLNSLQNERIQQSGLVTRHLLREPITCNTDVLRFEYFCPATANGGPLPPTKQERKTEARSR